MRKPRLIKKLSKRAYDLLLDYDYKFTKEEEGTKYIPKGTWITFKNFDYEYGDVDAVTAFDELVSMLFMQVHETKNEYIFDYKIDTTIKVFKAFKEINWYK